MCAAVSLHEKDDRNIQQIFAGGNQSFALCSLSQVGVFVLYINLFGDVDHACLVILGMSYRSLRRFFLGLLQLWIWTPLTFGFQSLKNQNYGRKSESKLHISQSQYVI